MRKIFLGLISVAFSFLVALFFYLLWLLFCNSLEAVRQNTSRQDLSEAAALYGYEEEAGGFKMICVPESVLEKELLCSWKECVCRVARFKDGGECRIFAGFDDAGQEICCINLKWKGNGFVASFPYPLDKDATRLFVKKAIGEMKK